MGTVIYLKNKDTPINEAINEYIGWLDEKERLELSKEISSNPIFKNDLCISF